MPNISSEQLHDLTELRESMVSVLNNVIEAYCLRRERTFDEFMTNVLRPIAEVMGVERVFVDRSTENGGVSRLRRTYRWNKSIGGPVEVNPGFLPRSIMLDKWMEITRRGDFVMRCLADVTGQELALLDKYGLKSIILIPILIRGQFWGNIVFQNSDMEWQVQEGCMDLVQSFARLCAHAIIRHELELEVDRQNIVHKKIAKMESNILRLESESEKIFLDPLTGIYNRRFFDENLSRVIKTLSRSGGVLSLMMIDIDYFKNYNDTFGHSVGDDCLKLVADILSKNTAREDDFVARYGGDEFAIVLPNTDEDGARMIAEKLLDSVRNSRLPHRKGSSEKTVTISIGVATGDMNSKQQVDDFVLRADELLYKSKQGGRDRYTFGRL